MAYISREEVNSMERAFMSHRSHQCFIHPLGSILYFKWFDCVRLGIKEIDHAPATDPRLTRHELTQDAKRSAIDVKVIIAYPSLH